MTKQIKLLMLAGTIGMFVALVGCGFIQNTPPQTEATLSDALDNLTKEINETAKEVEKAAKEIEKTAGDLKMVREEIKAKEGTAENKQGTAESKLKIAEIKLRKISDLIGANPQDDKLATILRSHSDALKARLEAVKAKAKTSQAAGRQSSSTGTSGDSLYYFGAVLLAALFIGLLAGWGGGTLAAKRRLTKAGFW